MTSVARVALKAAWPCAAEGYKVDKWWVRWLPLLRHFSRVCITLLVDLVRPLECAKMSQLSCCASTKPAVAAAALTSSTAARVSSSVPQRVACKNALGMKFNVRCSAEADNNSSAAKAAKAAERRVFSMAVDGADVKKRVYVSSL